MRLPESEISTFDTLRSNLLLVTGNFSLPPLPGHASCVTFLLHLYRNRTRQNQQNQQTSDEADQLPGLQRFGSKPEFHGVLSGRDNHGTQGVIGPDMRGFFAIDKGFPAIRIENFRKN